MKQWRPVATRPQRVAEPSLPPAMPRVQSGPAQASYEQLPYEQMPYVGEFITEHEADACGEFQPCRPQCGCPRRDCCAGPLRVPGPFACASWVSAEYLLWAISGADLPPLVTTSPAGTLPANTGLLGNPGTSVLFGDDSEDLVLSGLRITGGWWLDAAQTAALELHYAGLPSQRDRDSFDSSDFPLLARPVFDTLAGVESAMVVAHPSFLTGNVTITRGAQLHLAGAIRRDRISQSRCRTIDSLIGLRFASLEEDLLVEQSSRFTVGTGQVIAGTTLDLFDRFETDNRFFGVLLGLDARERLGTWFLNARGSLSLGNNRAEVMIDGATVTSVPGGGTSTAVGGLLAQQTNLGTYSQNRFVVIPELSLAMSTHLTDRWHVSVGYHLLYWSDAARPGEQIDRQVSQFPPEPPSGTFNPAFEFNTRGVLIHGLQTGLTYQF